MQPVRGLAKETKVLNIRATVHINITSIDFEHMLVFASGINYFLDTRQHDYFAWDEWLTHNIHHFTIPDPV